MILRVRGGESGLGTKSLNDNGNWLLKSDPIYIATVFCQGSFYTCLHNTISNSSICSASKAQICQFLKTTVSLHICKLKTTTTTTDNLIITNDLNCYFAKYRSRCLISGVTVGDNCHFILSYIITTLFVFALKKTRASYFSSSVENVRWFCSFFFLFFGLDL